MKQTIGINRMPTPEEKAEMVPLGGNPYNTFAGIVAEIEQQYKERKKPFCTRCAKLELKDKIDRMIRESERKVGYIDMEELNNIQIDRKELEEYGRESRFKDLGERKIVEQRLVSGTKMPVPIIFHEFQCKIRGCKLSIEMGPEEEVKKAKK